LRKKREITNSLWETVGKAVKRNEEITIAMNEPGINAEIKTIPGSPVWQKETLVQIRIYRSGYYSIQTYDSVGSAMEALNAECKRINPTA
jgi:hypothetical protein